MLVSVIRGIVKASTCTDISLIDDAKLYDGAHVAVQVVCRRLQEEKALMIAEHIGKALRSG